MYDPWDVPPIPTRGDEYGDALFAAIGRALIAWEEIEVSLAHLYSALCEKSPYDDGSNLDYGLPSNFNGRLEKLNDKAETYFIKYSNQGLEGRLHELLYRIKRMSARRNDIAHGVVRLFDIVKDPNITLLGAIDSGWCLVPPHFKGVKHYDRNTPIVLFTSRSIKKVESGFWTLKVDIHSILKIIELPHFALTRQFALPPLERPPYPELEYTPQGLRRRE
ncbi:hypothetical protein [Beijerinckia sp. L45]|uniref:hypothetical protein n=1 Tax=Beijerinckia sp. L45 TaxID=1641855 RepID=UPI00131CEF25|nr:hypothetical protein [Beijerinckia sp. L45]